jgi:hypothetical protein
LICGKFIQLFLKGVAMNEKIPSPITFNTHKHHFRFLLQRIGVWKNMDWEDVDQELLLIGENLLDFYTGDLTIDEICDECLHFFQTRNISNQDSFLNWLHPNEYRKIKLNDSSEWVVKRSIDSERYIHIHPAKFSPHTIRVRAATLKTVIALMIKAGNYSGQMDENLLKVNQIRTKYLQLSPVKSLQRDKGILQLWELFVKNY